MTLVAATLSFADLYPFAVFGMCAALAWWLMNLLAANKALVERNNAPSEDEGGPASGVLIVPGVIDNPSAWTQLVQKK